MATTIESPIFLLRLSAGFASGAVSGGANFRSEVPYVVGSSAGQVGFIIVVQLSVVAPGTPTVIDLTSVRDIGGNLVTTMGHLTHWALANQSNTTGEDMTAGGGSNPVIAAEAEVCPAKGGITGKAFPNPGKTVDGTHKNFQVAIAAGANVPGLLMLWGRA